MRIGIMGAMPQEIATIETLLANVRTECLANREYHIGTYQNFEIVLVFSQCGKVASAITAATLALHYKVDQIIFTGMAGGVAPHLNIGDIVIGAQLYQHDMDPRPFFRRYEIPLSNKIFFSAEENLIKQAETAALSFVNTIKEEINPSTLQNFTISKPAIYIGKVATGDQVINSDSKIAVLTEDMADLLAVEMEGAAVAQVCTDYQIPFVIIRTISDKANHVMEFDFQKFMTEIASHYSRGLIRHLLAEMSRKQ